MSFPCPAFVGFIFLLLSFALGLTCLASRHWIEFSQTGNGTEVLWTENMGLWQLCGNSTCQSLDFSEQPGWFKSVQVFHVIGCGGLLLAVSFSVAFIFCVKYRSSLSFCKTITADIIFSLLCLTIATVVLGVKVTTDHTSLVSAAQAALSWTFYVAVGNIPLLILVILMYIWEARRLKIIRSPYLDITA